MSNQHSGDLRAAILEACARPYGLATNMIPGYTIQQVGRMVQKLQAAGLIHRAKVQGKHGRYFDSAARAEEYAKTAVRQPATMAKRFSGLEARPTDIKPMQIANTLRGRFAPDDASSVINSRECRPWAEAATA